MRAILFYVCLSISSLTTAQESLKQKSKLDRNTIVILKSKDKKNMTLNDKEVLLIENILQKCINAHNANLDSTSYQFLQLKNYKRQYIAYSENSEKFVWVNCFCNEDAKLFHYWRKKPVLIYDGGGCYFNLLINLSTQKCQDFWVNGLAYKSSE